MNWKIGDHAIVVNVNGVHKCFNGLECAIESEYGVQFNDTKTFYLMGWEVRILDFPDKTYGAGPKNLIPITDDRQLVSWESCIWQPDDLKVSL